ncbi:hypothetical protein EC968_002792 [Mortierella alpina]|nr:hypothetical protein EC968_002792 [Mortierella alpina]
MRVRLVFVQEWRYTHWPAPASSPPASSPPASSPPASSPLASPPSASASPPPQTAMPSSARPPVHAQLSGAPAQPTGPVVDPAFTAPDFDIKAWINAALDAAPRHQDPPSSTNGTSPNLKSTASSLSLDMASDGSLDASLDLLQTPALDPVLGDKDQTDGNSLSSTSTPPTSQQDPKSSATGPSKSQNALLTQHATNHLTKLHILASQTSTALSSVTQDVVKLLPRLTHELDQLRQETKSLQEGIRLVRSDFNTVDSSDTVQALDRLKYLDLVKTRMEATHSALREAENWRNLEAEANDIFAKGDFTRAATRLSEAERSLVVYKNTKVEGDRMALLLVLKDQLEQQVMGRVKEALEQKDTAACQTLINVFNLIGRQEKFQEYYISQRRTPMVEHWRRLTKAIHMEVTPGSVTARPSSDDSKDFFNVLQTFYKDASSMLHDEFAWITSIFADPSATIHSLVHDIFTCIDPSMQATLQHVAKIHGDEGTLPVLISAFAATESFGTRMERVVSQPLVGNQREHTGNRPRAGTLVHDNNAREGKGPVPHPLRSSFGHEALEIGSIQDPHEWAYVLYEPFMAYQRDYGKLEGAHLRALLSKSVPAMATYSENLTRNRELAKSSSSLVKIMTNTNSLAFNLAEGAIARCMRLTHGFGAPGLLDGLNTFFKDIMDRYSEILMECRQKSGLQVDDSLRSSSNNNDSNNDSSRQGDLGRNQRMNSKYGSQSEDDDASEDSEGWDEDVNEQDQRLFQMGLRLMVLCRQFCLKLEQLDAKTKKALRGVEDIIRIGQEHQDAQHAGSPLEQGSVGSGLKLNNVQPPNASIALLQQSNLNSFRLSEILEIVKKSELKDSGAQVGGLSGDGASTLNRLSAETDLGLEPKANHLFLQTHQRAVHLTKLCQRFIFDSVYIPLVRPIADLALLPCWTEGIDQPGQGTDGLKGARRVHQSTLGGTRTDVIKFRSSPSDYMEELLRQLLGLPLTFGMYEGDEGLRFGIHSLPYADRPFEPQELHPDASVSEQPSTLVTGADEGGVGLEDHQSLGVGEADPVAGLTKGTSGDSDEEEVQQQQMAEEDDLAVMHRWITSLSRAAMHTIIERLYDPTMGQTKSAPAPAVSGSINTPPNSHRARFTGASSPAIGSASPGGAAVVGAPKERHYLSRLSEAGAKQLEMDLGYFVDTCLSSLAIEPTPSIRSLIKALRLSESGLLMALQQLQQQQQQQQQREKDLERDASFDGADSPGVATARSKRASGLVDAQPPQVTVSMAGVPVLPSILAAGEEDLVAQMEQEQKIFEWVARLRGMSIPNA